jgi:hypothetical protein
MRQDPRFPIRALAAAAMLALALPATAQLSSATVRGAVTAQTKGQPGATITATNTATGQITRTTTRADGSYTLVGLAPGSYRLETTATGFAPQTTTITVLVGQTVDLDVPLASTGTTQLNTVTVIGSSGLDRKTSEVGTNITAKQIEALPQNSRNFLAFADLAPGVRVDTDPATGYVTLRGGAQNRDNVNVFIDGLSQKNYILRGGVAGSDSTQGNNFPQSAIAEYKVLSSNYKAEFDQVSSTAITAVTRSGTNELHGDLYIDRTGTSWRAYSPFELRAKDQGIDRVSGTQYQYGFSLGGPIKQDVAHYFIAYDEKDIDSPRTVLIPAAKLVGVNTSAGLFPSLLGQQGSFHNKFREKLFFGKIDLSISEQQRLELTARLRDEHDPSYPEDINLSAADNVKDRVNKETRLNLKHEWTGATVLNEANVGYEDSRWNPHALAGGPFFKYKVSPTNVLNGGTDLIFTGSSPDAQDRRERAFLIQDDVTYTGWLGHVVKTGVKMKDVRFDLSGTPRSADIVQTVVDSQTGLPYYDAVTGNCTSAAPSPSDSGTDTASCHIDRAQAAATLKYKDKQFGLYIQDDWSVTKQLEFNLGVRWDYETNMLNDDYATPADRVASFGAIDTRAGAVPGQTYAQSLAKGGININDYISTGSSRKAFKGALQPRIGFSYDLTGDKNMVVFGGVGRAYDRTIANHAIDELRNNLTPNGEVWMIKNDHKMPYTDQFSLGLRKGIDAWNGEVGFSYARGHNQFNWFEGNRDPQGGFGSQSPIDPLWGGPPGFGNLILGDFITQTKTSSVYLKLEKPYTKSSGWGVAATYTYTDGQTTNREWTDDTFNFTYGKPGQDGYHPSVNVERHRLVGTGVIDGLLPWGLQVSGKMTLGSGLPYRIVDCSKGFSNCVAVKGEASTFRQVDLGVAKDIELPLGKFTLRADIINLFNTTNYGSYDSWVGGPGTANALGGDNANLGVPGAISGPMRTVKLSMRYAF